MAIHEREHFASPAIAELLSSLASHGLGAQMIIMKKSAPPATIKLKSAVLGCSCSTRLYMDVASVPRVSKPSNIPTPMVDIRSLFSISLEMSLLSSPGRAMLKKRHKTKAAEAISIRD